MNKLQLPAVSEWLRAMTSSRAVGVDRDKKIVKGYIVAELGAFKTPGRGQFDSESLDQIVRLYAEHPKGLKSRFTHPGLSADGLGSYLGRSRNARRDGDKVRADLHLADVSFSTPNGNLGEYILSLAEEDADSFGSSLVLQTDKVPVLDEQKRQKIDEHGQPVSPIWRPTKLHASDVVDEGDATRSMLDAGIDVANLPDGMVRLAFAAIDRSFPGVSRDVLSVRLAEFVKQYLDLRYGVLTTDYTLRQRFHEQAGRVTSIR